MKAIRLRRLTRLAITLFTLLPTGFFLQSYSAPPTSAELKLRRNWTARHFDGKATVLPFTFIYGEHLAAELLPSWKLERQTTKPQLGCVQRTITCADLATGLRVRCDVTECCFTMWMAGGGIRGGVVYGDTDDFSYNVIRDPVHIRDLNATILHLMGIDHSRLTYSFQGLDQKLTGTEGPANPVKGILA